MTCLEDKYKSPGAQVSEVPKSDLGLTFLLRET